MTRDQREHFSAAIYLAVLTAISFYLCRNLLHAEYTGHTNSIQGLWISMARLAGEHWFRPSWWPYQDAGVPFEHTYMPLVPASTAIIAKLAGISAARAFHTFMGLVLCLGPATLYLMIWRMSRKPALAFWACLLYSLTSPARALLPETDVNPIRYWSSLRLYGTVVWDDLPHQTALFFLPLALLFLWRSFERPRLILTTLFISLTVLPSVFGATALFLGAACMLLAHPSGHFIRNFRRLLLPAVLSYLVVSPFLPPSLIATIRSNQQRFVEDRWTLASFTALAVVVFGTLLLRHALRTTEPHVRFFILFAFVAAAIPLVDAYLGRHFLPQPNRYTAEMEMGLALLAVPALAWSATHIPRKIAIALAVFLLLFAAERLPPLLRFTDQATRPVDMASGIEYRIAKWIDANLPGQRVMVPGSIAQWFNVFSDTPQLSGASYSTTPNWTQHEAMKSALTSFNPQETEVAVLWLKAFGVQAATAVGRQTPEFWKGVSSTKFDGLLPVLWREQDTTIYRVPQRSPSLAHVVPVTALGDLRKYVAALDDSTLPLAEMRWESFRRMTIDTTLTKGQSISVQTSYHRGWHARANAHPAEVRRDGLGFLVIEALCEGDCRIELTYNGGWEYLLLRALSLLTILGLAGYGWAVYGTRRRP